MVDQVTKTIIVGGNVNDIFNLWANFNNFPHFMKHIKSVTKMGERTSHWVMDGPLGQKIEWDAETTLLEPNKRIAWSSTHGDIKTSGQVSFNDLPNNETEVTAMVQYIPPAGILGEAVAKIFSDPEEMLEEDLRNFKAYAESMLEPASA